ncbi:hypothetical protein PHYBOEH_008186 [Phytophthora boehmeriae]|uniref:Uncharacterized protein n=1 Tax=Phytophthora boehmeriae TaxID=109152 RepID=A0A8T1X759_9STRA|nr:hypothetical protein PHYBOEH_008186 [Phytophthora boehmeriae]
MEALGIFQDDVDVQDSTTPIDDTHANNRVRERKLLHWINSLPLTKCLLVEELRDLRFGDVLHEIVEWLQCSAVIDKSTMSKCDEFATDTMTERLRRVVQLAARECRSQDTDAISSARFKKRKMTSVLFATDVSKKRFSSAPCNKPNWKILMNH